MTKKRISPTAHAETPTPRAYLDALVAADPVIARDFRPEMYEAATLTDLLGLLASARLAEAAARRREEAWSYRNLVLNTDSYKLSMPYQYPEGTTNVWSYLESRGGRYPETVLAGLGPTLELLATRVTREMVDVAEEVLGPHGVPLYRDLWDYIVRERDGRLPLAIRAVEEGAVVPTRNVLLSVQATDPRCWWLPTHVEPVILRGTWYPSSVATRSLACRRVIRRYLELTSDRVEELLPSRLHDFGARGATSSESAGLGGLAHLGCFEGTDNLLALLAARRYYGAGADGRPAGRSIPAAEHSTITAWGRDREADAYRNLIRLFGEPGAALSGVSDSYDLWHAVDEIWGAELKQHVLDSGALVVIRPDSGDPVWTPVETIRRLDSRYGAEVNNKGYRVLHAVAVLQGDGLDDERDVERILVALTEAGYAADNVAFGMGAGLLQKTDRDEMKWKFACSSVEVDGKWRDVYKEPATDPGKRSKRGRLALIREGDDYAYQTIRMEDAGGGTNKWRDQLGDVFRDGEILRRTTLDAIRERIARAA